MGDGGSRWRLAVPAGGDTLRQERLTWDLHDRLREVDGLVVGFADDDQPAGPGHKGAGVGDVALWATTATAVARPVSRILITLIKEWCAKERHRQVEVTLEGSSLTITGRPDAAQEHLVREFLDKVHLDKAHGDKVHGDKVHGDKVHGDEGDGPGDVRE
ncbi:hypothetical protein [Streptomyces alanosinicus]|uniref:Uncharacterized protein n=1 Tax=Streptomyces alanosinicus TaxID=68171 RepID=A0A919D662_9ACTN|nr:hypothetical protein [Streptomyces alanosinicus]GHE13637.1 hypothetical protein GCM10010339_81260 [Streptomyces alanosinicus]